MLWSELALADEIARGNNVDHEVLQVDFEDLQKEASVTRSLTIVETRLHTLHEVRTSLVHFKLEVPQLEEKVRTLV